MHAMPPSPPPPVLQAPSPQPPNVGAVAMKILKSWQPALGLDARNTFTVNSLTPDPILDRTTVRIAQYYQGVRVFGGEAIMHMKGERVRGFTDKLTRKLNLDAKPSLTPAEGLALALKDLQARGPFVVPPTTELVIAHFPAGRDRSEARDVLVYLIHTELENGTSETAHTDYMVDAHTGEIVKKWNALRTAAAEGVGHSQYSGKVTILTKPTGSGFELRDPTRGDSGNSVVDLAHGTSDAGGNIYVDADNVWGDGQNYLGGSTRDGNGQTAAVDAAYGSQWTWDYYKNVHGRNGIDGNGTATSMRVHYSSGYDNAFWSDSCFCMTFGDGSNFKSLEAMDVMGHEMSHGVCAATANLTYDGESGGLNEANSDIHGTMVEFYSRGGSGATIGEKGGNWTMGEQLQTSSFPKPLRYMYKPSLDGKSPDAWYDGISSLDVHYSSGPMNRCFYFLSQGASSDTASDFHSTYLPQGMKGVGNDKAARIWFRALTTYMTSSTDYKEARRVSITAAQDLYGAGGAEEQAVWNAFHAINVGDAWPQAPAPGNTLTTRITAPAQDLSVASGTSVDFQGEATDSDPGASLTYAWDFGDGATASGPSATHSFTNPGAGALTRTVALKASDATGASGSATRVITVQPSQAPEGIEVLQNGGFENATRPWEGNIERIGAWGPQPPASGKRDAWLLGSARPSQESLRQFLVLPKGATQGTLTFQLHVDAPGTAASAVDSLSLDLLTLSGSRPLGSFSNLDAGPGYVLRSLPLPTLNDEVAMLLIRASGKGKARTSFVLDDLSLRVK